MPVELSHPANRPAFRSALGLGNQQGERTFEFRSLASSTPRPAPAAQSASNWSEAKASRKVNCSDRNIIIASPHSSFDLASMVTADFGEDEAACCSLWRRSKQRMRSMLGLGNRAKERFAVSAARICRSVSASLKARATQASALPLVPSPASGISSKTTMSPARHRWRRSRGLAEAGEKSKRRLKA